ncbi:MAG: M48 family metallopeptidase [Firmicutes bacterium]|nr:M48 family metallopeptidase [Bacillota bacterium]
MKTVQIGTKQMSYDIRYKNIKNTYLRIKKNSHLLITTNKLVSESEIIKFIQKNEAKIHKMIDIPQRLNLYNSDFVSIFGQKIPLEKVKSSNQKIILSNNILIYQTNQQDLNHKKLESFFQTIVLDTVKVMLLTLEDTLGKEINLNNITFKSQLMKSQFGSCHIKKRIIKLNSVLCRFEKKYLHAILLHELIHLVVPGHQKSFYDLLLKYEPNYKIMRKELKQLFKNYEV